MWVGRCPAQARSEVFKALLSGGMREGMEGEVRIEDVRAPVFKILLQFAYSDTLPEVCSASCWLHTDCNTTCVCAGPVCLSRAS